MDGECFNARENPYASPMEPQDHRPSILASVTVFFIGMPFVIIGCEAVGAACYLYVVGEYDHVYKLSLMSFCASCLLLVGTLLWRLADMLNPRSHR